MQGRGLKQIITSSQFEKSVVAPYAGAWIETRYIFSPFFNATVAPYAGAWIETWSSVTVLVAAASPLMQGRGLKLIRSIKFNLRKRRPLCRGVD